MIGVGIDISHKYNILLGNFLVSDTHSLIEPLFRSTALSHNCKQFRKYRLIVNLILGLLLVQFLFVKLNIFVPLFLILISNLYIYTLSCRLALITNNNNTYLIEVLLYKVPINNNLKFTYT